MVAMERGGQGGSGGPLRFQFGTGGIFIGWGLESSYL